MKPCLYLIFLILANCISGCSSKKETFAAGPGEYITHVAAITGIDPSKIVVTDKAGFAEMAEDVMEDNLYVFYGVVHQHEVYTAANIDIKSCWGQFLRLYGEVPESAGVKKPLSSVSFLNGLEINPSKKTVIFMYSVKYSKRNMRHIRPVMKALEDDPDFDYYFISGDNPDFLRL